MSEFASLENIFKQKFADARGSFGKKSRQKALDYFLVQGVPSKNEEAWKYTSLKSLTSKELLPKVDVNKTKFNFSNLKKFFNKNFHQIFVIDGELFLKPSDRSFLKNKVEISRRGLAVSKTIIKARKRTSVLRQESLEALNSAFSRGIFVRVADKVELKKPLQIFFYCDSQTAQYPRLQTFVGSGAKLELIETYAGGNEAHFTNSLTEICIDRHAQVSYLRVQDENKQAIHFGCSRFFLHEDSRLESLIYATGGKINRHNLDIHCLGENAQAFVNGLTVGGGEQHFDNSTRIDHVVGHCSTNQLYKSLLGGKSKAVFRGQVEIRPGAQKASSEQLNKNLLLSTEAEADSVPQLNIYADDVKATHGSTVGQMSEEEIFYLLSRAISREKAIEMVSLGFVKDLVDRISNVSTRKWLEKQLEKSYQELQ